MRLALLAEDALDGGARPDSAFVKRAGTQQIAKGQLPEHHAVDATPDLPAPIEAGRHHTSSRSETRKPRWCAA